MARPKGARDADYQAKRTALLHKLSARLVRMDDTRPSLRQLAAAADVTVPTLRHYFGTREEAVEAVLLEYMRIGDPYIQLSREPQGQLDQSIRAYLRYMLSMFVDFPLLGDIYALGVVEGVFNHKLGPVCLHALVEPMLDALGARLTTHQDRGEMIAANVRHAGISLTSPLLMACFQQNQMYGRALWPLNLSDMVEDLAGAFVRAYGIGEPNS